MGFIKRNFVVIAAVLITALYFFTRLYNILGIPIFTDEAIYIRWSQIALQDASWRFISLTDGKQPMYVWIAMIFLRFVQDPLLAGRLVSVLSGFFTLVGIFFLTKEIFKNQKTAILACLLYVLFPFALVYDRIALYDSLVAAFIVWSLYFEILLIRRMRLDLALILGMILGAGMLTKTSANFALILLPFSLLLFNFKEKFRNKKFIHWVIYALVAAGMANLIYSILRLSPFFYIINQKNYVFIYSPAQWQAHPFTYFFNNLASFLNWLNGYASAPFLILVLASFMISSKYLKEKTLLLLWFIIPLVSTALFGKLLYPRFMLFMTIPLIPLAAYSLYFLIGKVKPFGAKILILFVFIFMFLIKDFYIIKDFKEAQVPKSDKDQFITGWPSGVGVPESVKFLQEEARSKKIFVGTQGTFGLMPYALEVYLDKNPNIKIVGFWPVGGTPPEEIITASKKMPTYFIFYQECESCKHVGIAPDSWPAEKILQIEKEEEGRFFTLYKIKP
ncbi:glycosyltransferase family 39 protein [Patescibacteria group bacterium]|nr:glycosyltransferase family 39 protein [Patescibacteria group bacterium]MBU4016432.1 glycosyltransferase family 39 protein [Patescibacteria group bacterium]MBU4098456.1 glycosyltransferase family 39 protein [Patescibacteria group bacterium]